MPRNLVIEHERNISRKWAGYSYYDTPDGEDLFPKLFYTGKLAFVAGTLMGLNNAYSTHPLPTGNRERLERILKRALPAVGIASAFTVTVYYATRFRGKDDELNYVLGGIAAASVFGASVGRPWTGFYSSFIFAGFAYTKKYFQLRGKKVMQNLRKPKTFSSYYLRKFDTSVLPDNIRGNWSKTLPKD